MKIESIPVELIRPARYNPRRDLQPGDPKYSQIDNIISEFGLVEPLVWNRRTGNLVGGHQRLKILIAQGADTVECSVVDLDEAKEKVLNLALNNVQGEWDEHRLSELLNSMEADDQMLAGFAAEEIAALEPSREILNIEELLHEVDIQKAERRPIWAVIRTGPEKQNALEAALRTLENSGIRVERSYDP